MAETWGDKGHGSFKLNLQLCNLKHPNSQKCTNLISMFMASDSVTNLHTCLDMYADQIKEIDGMEMKYVHYYCRNNFSCVPPV